MPACSHSAGHPNQDSYAYGDSESDQRAVLDLAGHPVQGVVAELGAELGGFVTETRGLVAGQAPGLKMQSDLFTDATGHGTPPLKALVGYVNYAVIYRRSPVGLPVPDVLKQAKLGDQEEKLNRLLQELAWEAVLQHPLSGVRQGAQLHRASCAARLQTN
jgi:hypothetical protein